MKTVRCFNNTGLEDFLVLDKDYQVVSEDKLYYYMEADQGSAFFKARFHGDTQECLDGLSAALDKKGISTEEKASRMEDIKEIIAKTEETLPKIREMKKMGIAGFIQKLREQAALQRKPKQ